MGTDGPSIDAGLLSREKESTGEGGKKERRTVYRIRARDVFWFLGGVEQKKK